MNEVVALADEWKETKEEWREYRFPDGERVRIYNPLRVKVTRKPDGDAHRIEAKDGIGHYVRAGWLSVTWKASEGAPVVQF